MKILKAFICILSVKCQAEENGTDEILEAPPIPSTTGMILNENDCLDYNGEKVEYTMHSNARDFT